MPGISTGTEGAGSIPVGSNPASAGHSMKFITNPQKPNVRLQRKLEKIEFDLHSDMQLTQISAIPCQVSSDVHEWRNDWRTVSRTRSVKIQYR
jgi:hypothetical protein